MKKAKFWILITVLLILQLADMSLTYLNTPDLSMEGNPLVAKFGLGWEALIIANVLSFTLAFLVSYYSYFKYKTIYTNQTKFTSYFSQIIYDRPDMFWKGLFPKHITPYIAGFGFSGLYAFIAARAVLVFEWIYITFNENWWENTYFILTNRHFFGRFDIVVSTIVTIVAFLWWCYKEFKKQLKSKVTTK